MVCGFLCPRNEESGGILIYHCPSGYRYMVCPAISSYSFGATALIFCRVFIHIMEVCMSTGFCFSTNILKITGSWTQSFCSSVRIQIHGLSGYLLLQFWSYSFNILYNVYTHNGGQLVHNFLWSGRGIICVLQTHFIF